VTVHDSLLHFVNKVVVNNLFHPWLRGCFSCKIHKSRGLPVVEKFSSH